MQVRRDKAAVGTVKRKEEVKGEMDRTSSVDSYDTESERERERKRERRRRVSGTNRCLLSSVRVQPGEQI